MCGWTKVLHHACVAYLTHFSYCQIQAFYQIHHSYFIKLYINHQNIRNAVFHSFSFNVFFSISPSPMPFFLWCPVLTLLPIDIVVKLSSSQPDWKLLRFFSVQVVFSPPRVLPQVRSIILRIVDGRSLVVKVHIEVVLSLPHVVLHGDALVHSDTALSLLFRLTHCPQIRTGHNLAWHFTQFHDQ